MIMRIINKVRNFFVRLFNRNKYMISTKGECLIQYAIDKYINSTRFDDKDYYISDYENMITRYEDRVEDIFDLPSNLDEQDYQQAKHSLASFIAVGLILALAPDSQRNYYANKIENESHRTAILHMRKMII